MPLNFDKLNGLVPAVVQDALTQRVLMVGFMNAEAYKITLNIGKVVFYSRTRQRLWTKGEESGNYLIVKQVIEDCDNDTLLIKAEPTGPVCHTGADTCFNEKNESDYGFLSELEGIITSRQASGGKDSYVSKLFGKGINKIAQKVGEEAVELVIEAKDDNDELFINEAADLLFHYLILLKAKGKKLDDVVRVLHQRKT